MHTRKIISVILACLSGVPALATSNEAEAPYSFTLPEAWRDVSERDVIAYESRDKSQQLTVAEYVLKKKVSAVELRSLLQRFIESRRQAELTLSKGEATIGSPAYFAESSLIKAEYWGSRQFAHFHSATIVWGTPNRIVSWRFEATDIAALRETVSRVKPTIRVK